MILTFEKMKLSKESFVRVAFAGAIFAIGLVSVGICAEQKYRTVSPPNPASEAEAVACLTAVKPLNQKKEKTASDILQIYKKEQCLSSVVYTMFLAESQFEPTPGVSQCVKYVKLHKERFVEVYDGWKGEDNSWKPGRYWLGVAQKLFPSSAERWQMEWEHDYADFLGDFKYVNGSKNKTCAEFYDGLIEKNPDDYNKYYSKDEVEAVIQDCEAERKRYAKYLDKLLQKYMDWPGVPVLFDIDHTNIISKKYFGLC